ncbi:hypothetical protein [Flavobacterium sp. H122]|uniref:hypothetical protein n=1 Tax=Flavobacterium sp. H122 TaxID=2529860 RepID=UPI0020BF03DA|nr:hypothetical protein [Flavobacterium sp. H122]
MRTKFFIAFIMFFFQNNFGQHLHLKISSEQASEKTIIDSTNYNKLHKNAKSIENEINSVSNQLIRKGYLRIQKNELKKANDSTFDIKLALGEKTKHLYICLDQNSKFLNAENDTIKLKFENTEDFLNQSLNKLEKKGQSLARLQLINFRNWNNKLYADLEIKIEKNRKIDDIIINGNSKFPESHLKQLKRQYTKKTFNQETLKKLHSEIEKFKFVKQTKYPEILFTQDSTKIYTYLEKTKPNSFDGFIGFNNIENKLKLNGYLDLKLMNILNTGEKFNIFWKSNGNQQKTFDTNIELPYILKSPLAIKAQLNIFKQDSTFQNAKTEIDLGYYIKYNSKIYIGYQSTESSDIQNTNNTTISDFNSNFFTTQFEYSNSNSNDLLFSEKTRLNIKTGFGSRVSNLKKNKQHFTQINISHNFYLNNKNIINITSYNFYLKSDSYIINELYRFGGSNSIRGFNENSLQGNISTLLTTEYRYVFNQSFYLHSIIDYGYFEDKTTSLTSNLKSFGFGAGLLTKNGTLNIAFANGSTKSKNKTNQNSIFHISYKTHF